MSRVLVTLAMLLMLPWHIVKVCALSSAGVIRIFAGSIARQWK